MSSRSPPAARAGALFRRFRRRARRQPTPPAVNQQPPEATMPIYKVKPESDYPFTAMPGKGEKNKKRYPSVTIPVSPEIIAALEVGGDVVVELKGKVRALESRQST